MFESRLIRALAAVLLTGSVQAAAQELPLNNP